MVDIFTCGNLYVLKRNRRMIHHMVYKSKIETSFVGFLKKDPFLLLKIEKDCFKILQGKMLGWTDFAEEDINNIFEPWKI